jgi:hypothetical protein
MGLYPSFQDSFNNSKNNLNKNINNLFLGRVKNIYLNNEPEFDIFGTANIGMIEFKLLNNSIDDNNTNLYAMPLFNNIKQYPLIEELVLITKAPSYKLYNNNKNLEYYYFPVPISIWNNLNNNALPDIDNKNVVLGKSFEESDFIKNIKLKEGDTILSGRYGNHIIFTQNKNNPEIRIINKLTDNINNPWDLIDIDINKYSSITILSNNESNNLILACNNFDTFNENNINNFNTFINEL